MVGSSRTITCTSIASSRPNADGRPANFVISYVRGTSEDPADGAHEAFLSEITGVADDVRVFSAKTKERDLLAWHRGQ